MPGAQRTHGPVYKVKSTRALVTTGSPDQPGIPCAMVLTVSFVLSPVIGFLATVLDVMPARRARRADVAKSLPS